MKKSLMIFVALVGITAISAQKKKAKAPAVKAPAVTAPTVTAPTVTAPTVTAPKVDMGSAGDMNKSAGAGMGLRIGLGVGYATSIGNKSTDNATLAAAAGGQGYANQNINGGATAGTGEGTSTSNSGIDSNLKIEYDVLSWLFVRTGFGYTLGLKNTFSAGATAAGVTTTGTITTNANQMEIPLMVGFHLYKSTSGSVYFGGGAAYVSGDYAMTASTTKSDGTIYKDVENKIAANTLGITWVLGGRVRVAEGINLFGEVKWMSAAKAGLEVDSTINDGSSNYATGAGFVQAAGLASTTAGTLGLSFRPTVQAAAATKKNISALDMSYTRWNVGVEYAL